MNLRTLTPTKLDNGWTQGILFNLWVQRLSNFFNFNFHGFIHCHVILVGKAHCIVLILIQVHPSFEFCLSSCCLPSLGKASRNSPNLFNIRISNLHPSSNFPLKELGHSQSSQGSPIVQILMIHPLSPFIERSWANQLPWVYVLFNGFEVCFWYIGQNSKTFYMSVAQLRVKMNRWLFMSLIELYF